MEQAFDPQWAYSHAVAAAAAALDNDDNDDDQYRVRETLAEVATIYVSIPKTVIFGTVIQYSFLL